jgi:glycosyltransferase involved in cell wall biosynthesis
MTSWSARTGWRPWWNALRTIREQSLQPRKVLVIDDGSKDETPECVADWISEHPESNAELLRLPHRGVSNARSEGIAQLKTFPLLAMLDSDDLWPNEVIGSTFQEARSCFAAAAVRAARMAS